MMAKNHCAVLALVQKLRIYNIPAICLCVAVTCVTVLHSVSLHLNSVCNLTSCHLLLLTKIVQSCECLCCDAHGLPIRKAFYYCNTNSTLVLLFLPFCTNRKYKKIHVLSLLPLPTTVLFP